MKITYIIFIIFITWFSHCCIGEENDGKTITSSYKYSIEYNDSDQGNYGHKIEVKDGAAKVNVRSENSNKVNSAVALKPGKPYLPLKQPVIYSKPKEELAYVSAPESSTVVPVLKNPQPQQYSIPQVQVQPQKNAAVESALQKYSREQLSILLSQNKNPFLPIDPKDSINKFFSKYFTPQQGSSTPQSQPNTAYVPQVATNNYLSQYQTQSYGQTPAVPTEAKSQYPATYYTPSAPQGHSPVQQTYYQPQVQQSYQAPYGSLQQSAVASHTPSVPQTQSPVQYVYVPQPASHSASSPQSYGAQQSVAVQYTQQSYQPASSKQYVPNSSAYQSAQLSYSATPIQQNTYTGGYTPTAVSTDQGKQQYVTVPSSSAYQTSQAIYTVPKTSQPTQPSYQNVYGSSLTSQYPTAVSPSSYGAAYKPVTEGTTQYSQGNIDFRYIPTASQSPTVAYKPSETGAQSSANTAQYLSGLPKTTTGNFDFSKYAQHVPSSSPASTPSAVTYKPSESGIQSSAKPAQYLLGVHPSTGASFDFSKYEPYTTTSNQASPAQSPYPQYSSANNFDFSKYAAYAPASNQAPPVSYKPHESGIQSSSNSPQYYSGLPQSSAAPNYAAGSTAQDASKSHVFGANVFAGLQPQNYGSLFSGTAGSTAQDAAKYTVNPQGASSYPQFANSVPNANYKPVVENSAPNTKLQYQSPNVNSILGSGVDLSKFQSSYNPANSFPSGHNFNLNQISNLQASDNKFGQYAIDVRHGTTQNGAAQVMVHTNYNLQAQNPQSTYSTAPANSASDNSNVRYVYVPSYGPNASGSPSSPDATNHGK